MLNRAQPQPGWGLTVSAHKRYCHGYIWKLAQSLDDESRWRNGFDVDDRLGACSGLCCVVIGQKPSTWLWSLVKEVGFYFYHLWQLRYNILCFSVCLAQNTSGSSRWILMKLGMLVGIISHRKWLTFEQPILWEGVLWETKFWYANQAKF